MTIKAVLFDLDDTLWPVAPVIRQAELHLHTWLEQHAPAVTQAHSVETLRKRRQALIPTKPLYHYDLWALRHASLVEVLTEAGEDIAKAEQAMQVFAHARNQVSLYDDVQDGLTHLQSRLALGSISNGFADLEAIGLASYFKISLNARRFGCAKPDSRIFHAACAALALPPSAVVYVGDDLLLDVEGAQQAGLQAVWLNRHAMENQHQHVVPNAICQNFPELLDWLNLPANSTFSDRAIV